MGHTGMHTEVLRGVWARELESTTADAVRARLQAHKHDHLIAWLRRAIEVYNEQTNSQEEKVRPYRSTASS